MSFLLNRTTKRIYGKEYRIDVVSENRTSNQCCYEIYDSTNNKYIGSAGTSDEIYKVIREDEY